MVKRLKVLNNGACGDTLNQPPVTENSSNKVGRLRHRVLIRYALLQIPGLIMLILILIVLKEILQIPGYAVAAAAVLWVVKDAALYPFVGRFYDPSLQTYKFTMIGKIGIVKEPLAPKGKILVNGELWQAEAMGNHTTIKTGERVLVQGIVGLKLLVQPEWNQTKSGEKADSNT